MSQQMLHVLQPEAAVQQMGGKGMTQGLRVYGAVDTGRPGGSPDDLPHTHAGQAMALGVDEERRVLDVGFDGRGGRREGGTTVPGIPRGRVDSGPAHRYKTLPSPTTMHSNQRMFKEKIGAAQGGQFGNADPRGVEHFENRTIAHGQRVFTGNSTHETLSFLHGQGIRLTSRHTGGSQPHRRIGLADADDTKVIMEATQRRKAAGDRSGTAPGCPQVLHMSGGGLRIDSARLADVPRGAEVEIAFQVATVG